MSDERTRSEKEWDSGYWNGKSDAEASLKSLRSRLRAAQGKIEHVRRLVEELTQEPDIRDERVMLHGAEVADFAHRILAILSPCKVCDGSGTCSACVANCEACGGTGKSEATAEEKLHHLKFGPRRYTPEEAELIHSVVQSRKPLTAPALPLEDEPDSREEESLERSRRYPQWKVDLFRDSVTERQDQRAEPSPPTRLSGRTASREAQMLFGPDELPTGGEEDEEELKEIRIAAADAKRSVAYSMLSNLGEPDWQALAKELSLALDVAWGRRASISSEEMDAATAIVEKAQDHYRDIVTNRWPREGKGE